MIAHLLDLLPTRGPEAYDDFCDALLEGDHHHVAEKLKQDEGKYDTCTGHPFWVKTSEVAVS